MNALMVVAGCVMLLGVFAVLFVGMASTAGWKVALGIWGFAVGATAVIVGGVFLIVAGTGSW